MQIQSVAKREDINRSNVFISWTGADENIKSDIARYLKDRNLTVCESDAECAGNFMQWSVEAAVKSGVFLLVLTKSLVANEKSVARQEIKAWKTLFKDGEDYANRTVVVCSDLALLGEFTDENGVPYIAAADCLSCETFDIEKGLDERNLQNIYNKTVKLIVGRMSRIYADKSASGRGIDITRLLGVDLLDTEKTKVDFDKIYIPRSLKYKDEIYYKAKALADDTNNNVLFITAKAGSGKSCFIGQIINEYKNIDGALVLTATCTAAAKYCIANVSQNEKYPVLLQYLFKKYIEKCGVGESFYTIDNFASLIVDKIDGGKDVVVALDAMDEIALQDNTRAFVGHVEALREFCGNKVKVIITDRGQTAAKMFDGACICKLKEFNDDNVNEYCDKLFGFLEERSLTNKKLNIDVSDLKDKVIRLSDDIKRNPFMLTQVVSLYAMTGKINYSEIGMFDDITDVMFKSERLKFTSAVRKVMPSNIVEMLSEFAYIRQVTLSEGRYMTRSLAVKIFDRFLKESGETARSGLTGEDLTEYIVFRAFYSFKENKFFHERYGEYLTARYFCDKVLDEFGNVFNKEKLNELLSRCGDEHWLLIINLFIKKSNMQKISIPNSVMSIREFTFSFCRNLKSVTIPKGVMRIGERAFEWCVSLESISLPEGVISIGEGVFDSCSSLTSIILPDKITSIVKMMFFGCIALKHVKMSARIKRIERLAFYGCESLTNIIIPESVDSIGEFTFWGCSALKSIILPTKIKSIEKGVFFGCRAIKNIIIPSTVERIEERAFYGCKALKNITIPISTTHIGNSAFMRCISLKNIIMPDKLKSVGERTFYECTSLEKVTIPKGVLSIGERAFSGCSSLKEVIICEGVENIGNWAFYGCCALKAVYFVNTKGWRAGNDEISPEDLSDPVKAADLLRDKYSECKWERS